MPGIEKLIAKGCAYLKKNGIKETAVRAYRKVLLGGPADYGKWLRKHCAGEEELERQRRDASGKDDVLGVIILKNDRCVKLQKDTPASLEAQTYGSLAVCSVPSGLSRYLLVEEGTYLRPEAVYVMMDHLGKHPETGLLYCDHDVADGNRSKDPFCKPEYDPVLLDQMNYIGTAAAVSAELLEEKLKEDPDLLKRPVWEIWKALCRTAIVERLPEILYSIPACADARTDFRRPQTAPYHNLQADLQMPLQTDPRTSHHEAMQKDLPCLSVIIPNKDSIAELTDCVKSFLSDGGWQNAEILIVENNSGQEETFAGYRRLQDEDERIRVLTWKKEFNYAAINNFAASEAKGEYLLFLNNDTKIRKKGAAAELMKWRSHPAFGAAGAALYYGDDTIQHGGVVLGYGGIAGHAFEGMPEAEYKKTWYAGAARQMSAVTGACMLVKKEVFLEAGGFTEELAVAYNDIDLCMKIQSCGRMVIYDPAAELYHFESRTRGLEMTREKADRVNREAAYFCGRWKEELSRGDRFYSPNLTLEKPDFSLKR